MLLLRVAVLFIAVCSCSTCGVGHFSEAGRNICTKCVAGKFTGNIPAMIETSKVSVCPTTTDACGAFVSSGHKTCPCSGSHALLSFLQLGESVDTLQAWAAAGVRDFFVNSTSPDGSYHENCDELCGHNNMTCRDTTYPENIHQYMGLHCRTILPLDIFPGNSFRVAAPFWNTRVCMGVSGITECAAKKRGVKRICACGGAPIPLVSRGIIESTDVYVNASTCLDCARGSFSSEGEVTKNNTLTWMFTLRAPWQ